MKIVSLVAGAVVVLVAGAIGFQVHRDREQQHERDLGACGLVRVEQAKARLADASSRLKDAETLASVTARIALAAPVKTLQDLHRNIQQITVPPCLNRARYLLASEADHQAHKFMAFMANSDSDSIDVMLSDIEGKDAALRYEGAVRDVDACKPECPALVGWTEVAERLQRDKQRAQEEEKARVEAAAKEEARRRADEARAVLLRQQQERDAAAAIEERAKYAAAAEEAARARAVAAEKREAAEAEQQGRVAASAAAERERQRQAYERRAAAVRAWYEKQYMPAMVTFRSAAAKVGGALAGTAQIPPDVFGDACLALSRSIGPTRASVGGSGDPAIDAALERVIAAYGAVAEQCIRGHQYEARQAMASVHSAFGRLDIEFTAYGLKP
jgi:hypothetical protein